MTFIPDFLNSRACQRKSKMITRCSKRLAAIIIDIAVGVAIEITLTITFTIAVAVTVATDIAVTT